MGDAGLRYEVVLVDDGSSDITADVLDECRRKYPLTVVQHQRNRGLAETIRDGLLEALRRAEDADVIVTMDADGTHIPSVILEMMTLIDGGCDVVVASRFRPGATVCGVPPYRQGLSVGASWLCRILFPTRGFATLPAAIGPFGPACCDRHWRSTGTSFSMSRVFPARWTFC